MLDIWEDILYQLETVLSTEDYHTWILPLQMDKIINKKLILISNNKFIKKTLDNKFKNFIQTAIDKLSYEQVTGFEIIIKTTTPEFEQQLNKSNQTSNFKKFNSHLNSNFRFDNFVSGKSNEMALESAKLVVKNPGKNYNPLYIYGSTSLGKTHLIHAIGHELKKLGYRKVLYIRSELFVRDMISALSQNKMEQFKKFYQSLDVLLMDDIQFLAKKPRSQEEFFYSFNYLLDGKCQIVVTSDKFPKELDEIEDRLKSRFGSGLTVIIEPPEYETRVAILQTKANALGFNLPDESAFFIARLIKSNVRDLEGALNNVHALANLKNSDISIEIIKQALKDLISAQNRIISINNIQQIVAKYFKITLSDLLSKSRSRSLVRPRQIAMTLTKELTEKSLPEIGESFGNRDHTTVIHANKKIKELRNLDEKLDSDYKNLLRQLSS